MPRRPAIANDLTRLPFDHAKQPKAIRLAAYLALDPLSHFFGSVRPRVPTHRLGIDQHRRQRRLVCERQWTQQQSIRFYHIGSTSISPIP